MRSHCTKLLLAVLLLAAAAGFQPAVAGGGGNPIPPPLRYGASNRKSPAPGFDGTATPRQATQNDCEGC